MCSSDLGVNTTSIENAVNGFSQMSIGTVKPQLRVPPGMSSSGKRPKPGLNLGNIIRTGGRGGGTGGAGLGAGRPSNWVPANQRPQASATPFSNFRSIVCVLSPFVL